MGSRDSKSSNTGALQGVETFIALLREMQTEREQPLVVAIDGRSGTGKSTLSAAISRHLNAAGRVAQVTIIEGDDFYAGGSAETWDRRTAAENSVRVIDWRRQKQVLEQILRTGAASWNPFDWDSDLWDSDVVPLRDTSVSMRSSALIILEGVYSCRPELHDLIDLKVLLEIDECTRVRRLIEREGDGDQDGWLARWSAAENYYFASIMPRQCFDHIVQGC